MNLLEDPWIPVRADNGAGAFRLLSYRDLLCEPCQHWQISLPRDDLELACLQLLVCMTQVMFLPDDDTALRQRRDAPLSQAEFDAGIAPFLDWFDLDHPTQPFMQTRGVEAAEPTPIQKLLIGLPEGNNHAFFNEAGEVGQVSGPIAAIALFNQANNCPSFGGGFKGSLRGRAPITTLVFDHDLRRMVWRNVLTRPRVEERQIAAAGPAQDQPCWVSPIAEKSTIHWNQIGLMRGLFWQPAHVELVKAEAPSACDVLGGEATACYSGFLKEKFNFTVEGVWPHPHGAMTMNLKKGVLEQRFASFTTTAPAWTQLSEFVIPRGMNGKDAKEGSSPAAPISQFAAMPDGSKLSILIGGYQTKQASVLERRHEIVGIASGWQDDKSRLHALVNLGKEVKKALYDKLMVASGGYVNKKHKTKLKGLGVDLQKTAEKLFYARTEDLIHQTFSNDLTWKEWPVARANFIEQVFRHGRAIFSELTEPYMAKPDLIPIIAWAERCLNIDLKKLKEDNQ
ncbi:MAG: type I-E CRISPR-associated protein Cse1/CasA [Xanthomonadaceae bacterium]|nr:type I-E CRISPR-associated protein Cse1/CasA [Xanthomonadaceae bacterium]MDP2184453.1 type I-E CRISPR-associated protein Cse1/CasA [Xanthomonadales bacterium]MDZ4114574.1 type I-E CRISPR-associated protein Cse1/CasA [Xanthomonadaceae bacterium]MDZ4377979.1 type I-E CRISPR-associated protein Cse1/CasA [Xanthomonadaceae bacterium]